MKPFTERNPLVMGAIGLGLTAGIVVGALQYDKIPFISQNKDYSAYFAEAGGLTTGARVQVSGSGWVRCRPSSWTGRGCWSSSP